MSEIKTHWKKVFDSDYLGACDLEDGKDLKATIAKVEIRSIKGSSGEKQDRNVATFTDSKIKPMVLNATNCKLIKKFTGSTFIEDWKNCPISIYVKSDIKAFGDITEGLRIREIQPKASKPELTPESKNWESAIKALKEGKPINSITDRVEITQANLDLLILKSKEDDKA
jgi:hypothetical protein